MTSASNVLCVMLPVRIVSVLNLREHWRKRAARARVQRDTARMVLMRACLQPPTGDMTIALTRIAPRRLDGDNCQSGFKAVRDGIADWLGIDDGDKRLTWAYAQRTGKPQEYAAEVVVEWAA